MKKNIKEIIYVAGIVLNQNTLKKFVNSNMPNIYCHHMTVKYGNINKLPDFLGLKFKFIVDKIFFDDKAIAAAGHVDSQQIKDLMAETDQHAHITICTAQDVKPVYSNDLLKTGSSIEYKNDITLKFGAFVVFEDNSTGWVFKSK